MIDLFVMLIMTFFAIVGLNIVAIVYVVKMLRRLEDKVMMLEEVMK
ncbi:MAG: hypothetical protein J7L51_02960 [Desulfurococcales archaeon]|nr:hypothetical protein [Desulfurococcales archaeon]